MLHYIWHLSNERTSWPSSSTVPASTSYSRCSSSASAVFPHPRAPTIAAIAPGAIVSEHVCKRGTCCAICVSMLIYE